MSNKSCGIIPFRITNGEFEFFVSHPTGARNYWAFCKGGIEGDESWADTAIREFKEETGLTMKDITSNMLIPLGNVQQNPRKSVVAFALYYPDIDPTKCFSNMCEDGVTPENDGYRWMTYEEIKKVTHRTHLMFYQEIMELFDDYLHR